MRALISAQLPAAAPAARARRRDLPSAAALSAAPVSRSAAGPASTSLACHQSGELRSGLRASARAVRRPRASVACSASLAAAGAAAAVSSHPFVEVSFIAATIYASGVYAAMFLGPKYRAILESGFVLVPLAILYGFLLALSWQPDTLQLMMPGSIEEGLRTGEPQFFPKLQGIMALLSRRATAASAWVHLLTINIFSALHCYSEGLRYQLPYRHSLLVSMVAGPLGLACHFLTRAAVASRRLRLRVPAGRAPGAPTQEGEAGAEGEGVQGQGGAEAPLLGAAPPPAAVALGGSVAGAVGR